VSSDKPHITNSNVSVVDHHEEQIQ